MADTPESLTKPEKGYHSNSGWQYSLAELGQWVHLLMKRSHHRSDVDGRYKDLTDAQNYLDMMQEHILAGWDATLTEPKGPPPLIEVLGDSHSGPTKTLVEIVKKMKEEATQPNELSEQTQEPALRRESEPEGIIYGDDGEVLAISAQAGERGYDPDAHEKQIRIFCDDKHIETAHTADTECGFVKYYEKNEKGRIKTKELRGKVEIKVHIPDGQVEIE